MIRQLEEIRKTQSTHTAQLIECLSTIAGSLEQISRQQALLLARAPGTLNPTPPTQQEAVAAKARPKPSTRPGIAARPRARPGYSRRPFRPLKSRVWGSVPSIDERKEITAGGDLQWEQK
eukprot:563403-Amphidinium_carterae.1